MKKNETKLLASRAVNKIGNVMYDYGNSTWIAGLGSIGQKYMGILSISRKRDFLIFKSNRRGGCRPFLAKTNTACNGFYRWTHVCRTCVYRKR